MTLQEVNKEIHKLAVHGVFDCEKVRSLYDASNRLRREEIAKTDLKSYVLAVSDHFCKEALPEDCAPLLKESLMQGDTVQEACHKIMRAYYPHEAEVSLNR